MAHTRHTPTRAATRPAGCSATHWRVLLLRDLRSRTACLLLAIMASVAQAAAPDADDFNGFDVRNASIPIAEIQRGGPPRDGIPAIDDPRFVSAAQARLSAGDRILGVSIGNVARAYPVRILNWHEVVNDNFAGRAVAITYCPLCGTGMAFDTHDNGRSLRLGVSGLLYNSDVLLFDRASDSLWSQLKQLAISGPRKGTRLHTVPLSHTSWADWRARHPDTQVLSEDTGFARDYRRDPYAGYDKVQQLMFDVSARDDRLPLKEWVVGVRVGDTTKAYPFSVLARRVDANGMFSDTVAGQRLQIRYSQRHHTAEVRAADGSAWPSTMAFWFAWFAFHPQTDVLQAP